MSPSAKDLTPLVRPRSIAVVGATPPGGNKLGSWALSNLLKHNVSADLYLVNPRYETLADRPCYPDLGSLPEPPELVLVLVPAAAAIDVLRQAEAIGSKAAIVFSGGFGEGDRAGSPLDLELQAFLADTSMAVCGPNTNGIINCVDRIPAGFPPYAMADELPVGTLGVVSQSGALVSSLVEHLRGNGLGLTVGFAVGNGIDLKVSDYVRFLAGDDRTEQIVAYVEGLDDADRFFDAADEATRAGKPVIVLKGGRSPEGADAVRGHIGALVGDYDAFAARCRQHGILTAHDLAELAALPMAQGQWGKRVGVLSSSGAVAGILADSARHNGFEVPPLGGATHSALAERMTLGEPRNPLDLTGQSVVDFDLMPAALEAMGNEPGLDVLVHGMLIGPDRSINSQVDALLAQTEQGTPIAVFSAPGWPAVDYPKLLEASIPVFGSADLLFRCLAAWQKRMPQPPSAEGPRTWPEESLEDLLADISAPTCAPAEYSDDQPAAVKLLGEGLDHKTDLGLVELNVAPEDIADAAARLEARGKELGLADTAVVVQSMADPGVELIVGTKVDPEAGPCVVAGLGGMFTELVDDVAIAPAPLGLADAHALLDATKAGALLDGYRGEPGRDRQAAAEVLIRLGHIAARDHTEAEINPLIVHTSGVTAVDVLIGSRRS
ncbi:acetate--CoA ligase family protein [Candidatus Poriferisocius sp.]|uniref:acetate--CoA ligase family protein n=1 Tax=Candidatus Poriferisocius sp. TaxID=3101276 RepID=UPI003B526FB0